ncbi:MAG: orotidine-5'-phosphate decarboxylase [Bacteroidota bacterium]
MNKKELFSEIQSKKSYLCVGLDTDLSKIPVHLLKEKDPIFEFNRQIIEATEKYAVAYKPNIAFYEALGAKGWESLQKTLEYIPQNCFTIADAKRGDIGNTSDLYAKTFFDPASSGLSFDSVTVAPYMGGDSVLPFLKYEDKWVILLALTSNEGSADFQNLIIGEEQLFEKVLRISQNWGSSENMMYVIGATKADKLLKVRDIVPNHFLLVPGVGAQGGSLEEVSKYGMNQDCGLIVNSSRAIIYASNNLDFAQKATIEAQKVHLEMEKYLDSFLP